MALLEVPPPRRDSDWGDASLAVRGSVRAEVMGRVKAGSLRLREAGELQEVSYRQAKRIWASYRTGTCVLLPALAAC